MPTEQDVKFSDYVAGLNAATDVAAIDVVSKDKASGEIVKMGGGKLVDKDSLSFIDNNYAKSGLLTKNSNNQWTRDYAHMIYNGGRYCTLNDFKNKKAVVSVENETISYKVIELLDSSWKVIKSYAMENNESIVIDFGENAFFYIRAVGGVNDSSTLEIKVDFNVIHILEIEEKLKNKKFFCDNEYEFCEKMYWNVNTSVSSFGSIFTHNSFSAIPTLIKVNKGDYFYYSGKINSGGNASCWAFLDDCGELIESAEKDILYRNTKVEIKQDCFLAVASLSNQSPSFHLFRSAPLDKQTYHYQVTAQSLVDSSGNVVESSSADNCVSSFVGVRNDMDLMLYECFNDGANGTICAFFSKDNLFISSVQSSLAGVQDVFIKAEDIPSNAAYVLINVNDAEKYCPQFMQATKRYIARRNESSQNTKKKIALLGSSWSVYKNSRFGKRIWREEMLCSIDTYGRGGAGYIVQGANNNSCVQYQADGVVNSGVNYDSIFIWATSNDMYQSIPIGIVKDYTSYDSFDVGKKEVVTYDSQGHQTPSSYSSTFCGGINYVLRRLSARFPKARIYVFGISKNFAQPYAYDENSEPNNAGCHYTDYNNAIKACCENFGVVFVPVNDFAGFNVWNKVNYFDSDNQHLSRYGYVHLCKCILNFLESY